MPWLCSLAERAILDGMENSQTKSSVDQGESIDPVSSDDSEVLNQESKDEGVTEEPSVDSVEESAEVSTSNEENKELIVEKKKRISTKKKSDLTENDKEKS